MIEKGLCKLTKQEIVDILVSTCRKSESSRLYVERFLKLEVPAELLEADVMSAIIQATEIDESQINYNFDYDYQAYERVGVGFKSLIKLEAYTMVKTLALELMKRGSLQVECSDEGLMCEDIESCLNPVIKALKSVDTDGGQAWAESMIAADRVGFICDKKLEQMACK